jgi:hypothetical protein
MDKPPIGDVLNHYEWDGRVSGYGQWQNTRCPFHSDRNPSARVNEEEGVFHCHVCDVSGDAYAVVMKVEQVYFLRAKELIRDWTGFDVGNSGGVHHRSGGAGSSGHLRPERLVNSKLPAWAKQKYSRKLVLGDPQRAGRL